MARIRSIHPGFFTDEAAVTLSPFARLLLIGIWTECDDQGAFEWKPVTLKMRLLPVDNVDVAELLEELSAANVVMRYEHRGKYYGLVRNFRLYQRPKKPNSTHFIPIEFRTYVGLTDPNGEPEAVEGDPVPQKGEMPPQMEDGGWRMEDIPPSPDGDVPPSTSKRVRSIRDLEVDDELRDFARQNGKSAEHELGKFADYCGSKGKAYKDYRAAFRNWLRPKDWEQQTSDPPKTASRMAI